MLNVDWRILNHAMSASGTKQHASERAFPLWAV